MPKAKGEVSAPGREPLLPDIGLLALPYHHWSARG